MPTRLLQQAGALVDLLVLLDPWDLVVVVVVGLVLLLECLLCLQVELGAAILNAQCNNKLNLTIGYQPIHSFLLLYNSSYNSPGHLHA